jgi:hypothetical protein
MRTRGLVPGADACSRLYALAPKRWDCYPTAASTWMASYWDEEELTFIGEVGDVWITRHVEVGGGRPSLAGWFVVAWVSDGEEARLHIRTKSRTVTMPMVLRIVIDTVTSGSAAKGKIIIRSIGAMLRTAVVASVGRRLACDRSARYGTSAASASRMLSADSSPPVRSPANPTNYLRA